jgi:hypothetical protein
MHGPGHAPIGHASSPHRTAAQRDDQPAGLALGALHRAIRPCTGHRVPPYAGTFTHPLRGGNQPRKIATRHANQFSRFSGHLVSGDTDREGGAWTPHPLEFRCCAVRYACPDRRMAERSGEPGWSDRERTDAPELHARRQTGTSSTTPRSDWFGNQEDNRRGLRPGVEEIHLPTQRRFTTTSTAVAIR